MANLKSIFAWIMIFTTICWTLGLPGLDLGIKYARADAGVDGIYLSETQNQDIMITATNTPFAILRLNLYDSSGSGVLRALRVDIEEPYTGNGFTPYSDLSPLSSGLATSGISLWFDNGDGLFDAGSDILSTAGISAWDTTIYGWYVQFTGIDKNVSANFSNPTKAYIAFTAADMVESGEPRGFKTMIKMNSLYVQGGTINYWPTDYDRFFPPTWIGQAGMGGYGSPLVISEIEVADNEFIEIYNRSPENIEIGGWKLKYNGPGASGSLTWPTTLVTFASSTMSEGSYYLAGNSYVATATDATFTDFSLDNAGGYVGLFSPMDDLMDWVGYGSLADESLAEDGQAVFAPAASSTIERKAFSDATYLKMKSGGVLEFMGNGEDTNNNSADFILRPADPNPQNSSSTPEIPSQSGGGGEGGGGSSLLINEIYSKTEAVNRWLELFNRSTSDINLNNYLIKHKGGSQYTFPSITIASSSYLVVHWNQSGTNTDTHRFTGSLGMDLDSYGGDLILKNDSGVILDYVQYGGPNFANEAEAVSNGQWVDNEYVPNPLYGQSIGRRSSEDGDYNGAGDWQTYSSPSPAAPNMGGDSTAPDAVTNVALTDPDISIYGLDGNDIRAAWTPNPTIDPSFTRYEVYLLPDGVNLDYNSHYPIDSIYSQYDYDGNGNPQATMVYYGGGYITKDSANTLLSDGALYRAYIVAFDDAGNKSSSARSDAAALDEEVYNAGDDYSPPFIMHMGVWQAYDGSDLHLMARVVDDRLLDATHPLQVVWKSGTDYTFNLSGGATTDCAYKQADYYDCRIDWDGGWDTDTVVGYYLKAMDDNANFAYMSASPDADLSRNEAVVDDHPFYIDIMPAPSDGDGSNDLSGMVYRIDGNPLGTTTVFFEGMAIAPATSSADGSFSFADDTLDAGYLNIRAFREGYKDNSMGVFRGESVNFYMNEGDMYYSDSSSGGGGGNPVVRWTAPGDNMTGAPIDIFCSGDCSAIGSGETPMIIAFDRPMNSSTISDQNAADAGSFIYLTSDGNDRIAGKIYYENMNNEARFYSSSHSTLSLGTNYNIIVTQGVNDADGNPIAGNLPDGSYGVAFTTVMSTTTDFADFGTGGATMPPYVKGATPAPGAVNISRSSSVIIEFSEPMSPGSISAGTIKLYPVTNNNTWTFGTPVDAIVSLDQATQRIATLNPDSDLSASYNWWVLKVKGNAKSTMGVYLADPMSVGGCADYSICNELNAVDAYQMSFQINTGATDTTLPRVLGTFPNNNDGITSALTAINVGLGSLEIGFSEAMDPSTINNQNITLLAGSSLTSGRVSYDALSNSAKFSPYNALLANTQYTLRTTTNTKDLSGNRLYATSTVYFKTGSADTVKPEVMYANGDDYSIAISFTEPMNAAKQTDTANWTYSVLNPANYTVNGFTFQACANPGSWTCGVDLLTPYDTVGGTSLSGLGLSFTYDEYNNTVIIKGLAFGGSATDFQIFVDNVKDRSNNAIADSGYRSGDPTHRNAARAPLYNSTDTYGDLGPGTVDYNIDMGDMGIMKGGAFPMNMMAGQSSTYFVDIPTTKSIPIGGKIVLTFPSGFDVSAAAKDPYSPVNNDINEWNTGTVTIHSVTGSQSTRSITIIASTTATQDVSDYLHMDIKGIVNSSIPKDFGTDGYTVDIKTFTADNALLETISTLPFFITAGGTNSINGEIHGVANGDNGTMAVFMGSPVTGPMEASVTITGTGDSGADGSYAFSNLPDGEYYIFTKPTITINNNSYFGSQSPEPIRLSGSSSTKNIILTPELSGGAAIKVVLSGDFTTAGTADNVDIFAGSPNGFRKKTLNSVGSTNGTASTTLYLSAGEWMVGVGPAMPESSMSGPPPMPDWMPPVSVRYLSDGSSPGLINISIAGQSAYTISGIVVDGSSNGISDAEVFAYQPMGGYGGAYTKTATDGSFVLKIPVTGSYKIGAHKPGLPEPQERVVEVSANVSGLTIKITKPPYTISGKVLNTTGQAVAFAPVWAWQESGSGHADTMTDSTGNYILYVNNGTWHVEGDAPGVGWLQYERALTISSASHANINLSPPLTTNFYTISGTVGIATSTPYSYIGLPFANMPIRAVKYDANGAYLGREFNSTTDTNGNYTITVPAGIYRVDIWTQEYGELGVNNQDNDNSLNEANDDDKYANNPAMINATGGNVANADIVVAQSGLNDVAVSFTNGPAGISGYLNIEGVDFSGAFPKPNGFSMFRKINDLTAATTIKLANGDYFMFIDIPGQGNFIPDLSDRDGTKDDIVVSGARSVNFTLLDQSSGVVTVSGTVKNASNAAIKEAWVWVGHPQTGYHNGTQSAADGTYSLTIPTGTGYKIGADKPGYMSNEPLELDASTAVSGKNFTLSAYSLAISGRIYADNNSNSSYDSGEGVPSGFVRAETTKCSDNSAARTCVKSHSPVDSTGYYELGVVDGTWKVYGMADGYQETLYGTNITISGASAADKNIKLSANNNWEVKSKKKQITPATGGTLDDTSASGTKVKLTIPPNALGSSNSAGNVNTQKTSSVTETNSSAPVGGEGVSVTASDNSGQAIVNLNDYVDIEMVLYKADVDAAIASGTMTYEQLKNTKNGYWDSTANDWVNLATTRKAYYKMHSTSTEWTLYANAATTTSAFKAYINEIIAGTLDPYDYKLVFSSKTNHFTIFAVIMPFIAVPVEAAPEPDPDPPAPPGGGGGGGGYTTYCSSVSYGDWGECANDKQSREVASKSPTSCRLTAAQEADKERACVVGGETGDEEAENVSVVPAPALLSLSTIDELYLDQGRFLVRADIDEILPAMGNIERNHVGERLSRATLEDTLGIDLSLYEPRAQYALTNYITYGSPDTAKLGWGERAGVLNSFMAAFGKVPAVADDWSDIIKIANGRWPTQRSEMAENRSAEHFRKIYLREPNRANPHDDAAVTVVAYGLRPANRNMESEAAAIRIFKAIYGYAPTGAVDWDVARAIAYSGATR